VGRLEEFYHKFVEVAEKHRLEILGMNTRASTAGFSQLRRVRRYRNQDEVTRFREFHDELSKLAVAFEGTMSTYMSDTYQKAPYLELEHGASLRYMYEIKKLFDPKGILNPGKKFPRRSGKEGVL
jgi:FAD/FMN-containing dehydrogenase